MTSSARHTDFLQDQFGGSILLQVVEFCPARRLTWGSWPTPGLHAAQCWAAKKLAALPALCPHSPPQRLGLKDGAPVVLVQLARLSGWSPGWISWLDWSSWIGSQELVGQGMENRNDGRTALKRTGIELVFLKEQSVAIVPAMGAWRERQGLFANPCCS